MTQEVFASELGITPQAVSKWETGIGYPDVALFPQISCLLGVSIGSLFGEKERNCPEFSQSFRGMEFLASFKNKACYSSKKAESVDEKTGIITFSDGSTADVFQGIVYNRGGGEIAIFEDDAFCDSDSECGGTSLEQSFAPFESLEVNISRNCRVRLLNDPKGLFWASAKGSPKFISGLKFNGEKNGLSVSMKNGGGQDGDSEPNLLDIYMGFCEGGRLCVRLTGCGSCEVVPNFKNTVLSVSGSGTIEANRVGNFEAAISGSGQISVGDCEDVSFRISGCGEISAGNCGKAAVSISGSGDVSAKRLHDPKVTISGCGDVSAEEISGRAEVKISGSGSVRLGGEVGFLLCEFRGSGSFDGKRLTADRAELSADDGEIYIGRIVSESAERIGKKAVLCVGQRG